MVLTLLQFTESFGVSHGDLQEPGSHVQPGLLFSEKIPPPRPFRTKALEVNRMHVSTLQESSEMAVPL